MKKVSVVVPVYNAEKEVIACVESLLKQTLQDMEIILVDDCSTDNTAMVLRLLEEKLPDKIRVLRTETNQGAGGARNCGIAAAQGHYIGFVDADDIAAPTMFQKLYETAVQGGYDIVDCGYYDEASDEAILFTSDELTGVLTQEQRRELIVSGGYIWSKLWRAEFLQDENMRFRHNVILEDADVIAYAMATAHSIGNVKEILYCYKNAQGSLSKVTDPVRYYESCLGAMEAIFTKLSKLPCYEAIREAAEYEMLQMYSYAVNISLVAGKEGMPGFDLLERLERIRSFRVYNITNGYRNPYVQNKIDQEDIRIMRMNDRNPCRLAASVGL